MHQTNNSKISVYKISQQKSLSTQESTAWFAYQTDWLVTVLMLVFQVTIKNWLWNYISS